MSAPHAVKSVPRGTTRTPEPAALGRIYPLGATIQPGGVNFSVFSRNASAVDLLLFDRDDDARPSRVIPIDPATQSHLPLLARLRARHRSRTDLRLSGARPVRSRARSALRSMPSSCSILTGARSPFRTAMLGTPRAVHGDNTATAMKSVVVDPDRLRLGGRRAATPPFLPHHHLRDARRAASRAIPAPAFREATRGTYAGLIEKIPYLQELGITAVELLPVFQFDRPGLPAGPRQLLGLRAGLVLAPHQAYSSRQDPLGPVNEFRDMVKALHRAGIEVILDVVYNHTAEGDHRGPTLCFRGIDNDAYYILEQDRSRYANYSGTGNTLNANHPIVRRMILDSLRYWVAEMHVDGFRFDLASILARDSSGSVMSNPPVLWDIESDPALAGTKMIAEAWDAAGLYQVGSFVGDSWKEWNGRFRDDVRDFFRGDERLGAACRGPVSRQPRDLRPQGTRSRAEHQLRDLPRRLHAQRPGLLQPASTTRRMAKATATEPTTTEAGTAASKGPSDDPAVETAAQSAGQELPDVTMLSLGVP